MLAASSAKLSATVSGVVVLVVLVYLAVGVVNFVAVYKIITKAGYSGWWILLPLIPLIATAITIGVLAHGQASTFSASTLSVDFTTIVAYWVFTGIAFLVNWIFFLVFAFSDWPVRRRVRQFEGMFPPMPYGHAFGGQVVPGAPPVVPFGAAQAMPYAQPAPPGPFAPATPTRAMPRPAMPTATGAAAGIAGPVCPSCHARNLVGSTFCGSCGTALALPAASAPNPTPREPHVEGASAGAVEPVLSDPPTAPALDDTAALALDQPRDETTVVPAIALSEATEVLQPVGTTHDSTAIMQPTDSLPAMMILAAPADTVLVAAPTPAALQPHPRPDVSAPTEVGPGVAVTATEREPSYVEAADAAPVPTPTLSSPEPPLIAAVFGAPAVWDLSTSSSASPASVAHPARAGVTCPACDAEELASSAFCGQCGARLQTP